MAKLAPETVKLGEREFFVSALNTLDAFELVRKVAPLAPTIFSDVYSKVLGLIMASVGEDEATYQKFLEEAGDLLKTLEPILYHISLLPRQDSEDIIKLCLAAVKVKTASGNSPLVVNGQLMFDDLDVMEIMQLTGMVIKREARPIIAAFFQPPENQAAAQASPQK